MTTAPGNNSEYVFRSGQHSHSHAYLLPELGRHLARVKPARAFDLGCGNGSVARWMHAQGIAMTGVDYSHSGIEQAIANGPGIRFEQGSAYDDLTGKFGQFPLVVSLEVVEHLFEPRRFATTLFNLVEPGGTAFVSTPFHGYWKNLALALTGRMDDHFTALWDGGHVKFWSERTLAILLGEVGFEDIEFRRVGRIAPLAKSMVAIARRPRQ